MRPAARVLIVGLTGLALLAAACGDGGSAVSTDPSPSGAPSIAGSDVPEPATPDYSYQAGSVGTPALERLSTLDDGTTIDDLRFVSPRGGEASAWLVTPPGDGPFAGMLYLHGSETDRDDLLDEALAMATGGVASVVLDAPWVRAGDSRGSEAGNYFAPADEAAMVEQTVVDLRAAIDLLVGEADVDPARVGFMGHSWGASTGAILAAVDDRPIAFVLVTGRPSWTAYLRSVADTRLASITTMLGPEKWEQYLAVMAPYDATSVLAEADGEELLLQFGTRDDVVVPADVDAFVAAAPDGATVMTYDAGHVLDAAATADRIGWLVDRLGAGEVDADAIAAVGLPDAPTPLP